MAYLKIVDHNGNKIQTSSSYEGASAGRRMSSWMASSASVNSLIEGSINSLRARARHLRRNNPLADGGVDSFVADLIGTGITPSWQIENPDLKKEIQLLWNDFVEESDYDGIYDFYGQEALASQGLVESGESLVWLKAQPQDSDLAIPLQLQVLEGDHLDETYEETLKNGNEVRMGIEFDKKTGKRVAYWLWPEHPGESYGLNTERIRVSANEICHIFRATRPGQKRGTTWLSSVIVKMYDFDGYDDAELVRKKGAAMIGGYITQPPGEDMPALPFGNPESTDDRHRDITPLEPGMFPKLPPGMDVRFSLPADVGNNFEPFIKHQQRSMAKGIGTTYEKLTGDLTEVNLASIRSGQLDFQRACKQKQLQILAFQLCRPVAHAFLNAAVLSGALNLADYAQNKRRYWRIKWRPDAWMSTEPVKDQLAKQLRIRNGLASRSQIIAEEAGDPEEVEAEIKRDNEIADKEEFVFDSDPRKTAKSGTAQAMEESIAIEGEGK